MPPGDERTAGHAEYAALAAGYGLHALEPQDEQRLAAHLVSCASCARSVGDAAAVGAVLGATVSAGDPAATPPPELRDRLLAAARHEPQDLSRPMPEAEPLADPETASPAGSPPVRERAVLRPGRRRRQIRSAALRTRRGALVLAAVAGALVAVPVALAVDRSARDPGLPRGLAAAVTAPDAREATLRGAGATGKAVLSGRTLWLVVDGLPRNDPSATTYVVWRADAAGGRAAVATFDVAEAGPQTLHWSVPPQVREATALAVSYERGRRPPARPGDVVLAGRTGTAS